jgi:hypothetical protein
MKNIFFDADIYRVTDTYEGHIKRGSLSPGEDWGTGVGTGIWSIRDGIINEPKYAKYGFPIPAYPDSNP